MAPSVSLRAPTTLTNPSSPSSPSPPSKFTPPPLSFILGTWHVTHSTLPMWKTKRNVTIAYSQIPSTHSISSDLNPLPKLDDLVQYQEMGKANVKSVRGIDTPSGTDTGAWDWRGRGWLMIAGSHWEILGWGPDTNKEGDGTSGAREEWVVTYFAKTLFTPAGIDVYSKRKEGLSDETMRAVREALQSIEFEHVSRLAQDIFEVKRDVA